MNTIYIPYGTSYFTGSRSFEGLGTALLQSFSLMWVRHIILYCISLLLRIFSFYFALSRRRTPTIDMWRFTLLYTLACLILIVAHRARGFSSGAPEESCDSLTVNHIHVGSPAPGAECGPPCLTTAPCVETCRQFRQLRWIGNSSADTFIYNCNETYQCELTVLQFEDL